MQFRFAAALAVTVLAHRGCSNPRLEGPSVFSPTTSAPIPTHGTAHTRYWGALESIADMQDMTSPAVHKTVTTGRTALTCHKINFSRESTTITEEGPSPVTGFTPSGHRVYDWRMGASLVTHFQML